MSDLFRALSLSCPRGREICKKSSMQELKLSLCMPIRDVAMAAREASATTAHIARAMEPHRLEHHPPSFLFRYLGGGLFDPAILSEPARRFNGNNLSLVR